MSLLNSSRAIALLKIQLGLYYRLMQKLWSKYTFFSLYLFPFCGIITRPIQDNVEPVLWKSIKILHFGLDTCIILLEIGSSAIS